MQFLKLSHELITDTNITANEFRIYTYLLSLYNTRKQCAYPSIETISESLSISISTVKRSIKRLVDIGYMIVEKKKGAAGNYNTYKKLKHNFKNVINITRKKVEKVVDNITNKNEKHAKSILPVEYEKNSDDVAIEEVNPFTIDHQQKISLILKHGVRLTEKQMWLIGDMDLEALREAIRIFKKKKGRKFALFISLYIDAAERNDIEVSRDIERYLKGSYIRMSSEDKETQRALAELEMYGAQSNL